MTYIYDGWEEDARIIECAGGNGVFEGLGMDEKGVDRLLARMRRKQARSATGTAATKTCAS